MRKYSLLVVLLLVALVTGCGRRDKPSAEATPIAARETAEPSLAPERTAVPSSDPTAAPATKASPADQTPRDMAACVAAEAEFPVVADLPPVTADDQFRGSNPAPITLIEYSDFQ